MKSMSLETKKQLDFMSLKDNNEFREKYMGKHIANIITTCRIVCSICILFCPVLSVGFSSMYLFCGFTDMVDGAIARKTNSVSKFGTRLDSSMFCSNILCNRRRVFY